VPSEGSTICDEQSLDELRRELAEAREQQVVTRAILGAISNFPTDPGRVFAEIAVNAARLCDGDDVGIFRVDGDCLRGVAHHGPIPAVGPIGHGTLPLARGLPPGRAVLDRKTLQVVDLQIETTEYPEGSEFARRLGFRAALAVPLMHAGTAIGVITIRRTDARPFDDRQVDLLRTFADQAVIAIENARLFEAEQASKRELEESLEYQTATSEVLNVISRSPTDVQPVFDMIAESARRLCQSNRAAIFRLRDGGFHTVSLVGNVPNSLREDMRKWVTVADRSSIAGRVALDRRTVHVHDVWEDPASAAVPESARDTRRTVLGVPLLSEGIVQGIIVLTRSAVQPFTERQIKLVETFADQAVIAIENTRLFEAEQASKRELQEALQQQTATADVLAVISSSIADPRPVFDRIVASCERLFSGKQVGINLLGDDGMIRVGAYHGPGREQFEKLFPITVTREFGSGRAILERRILHYPDVMNGPDVPEGMRRGCITTGIKAIIFAPLLWEGRGAGAIFVGRDQVGALPDKDIALLQTFADQAVIAIENTRLFDKVQERTRELAKTIEDLEIASAHKSQFVANMSHELRTPLAAILGYAELMQEGFYDTLGQKSLDALGRIRSNGKHLLGLINTVLDIAKIESGQFTLSLGEYSLESVIDAVRSATESLAQSKKLSFKAEVAKSLPVGLGDEQRLTQVLLNLAGNAIKFTDAGEVSIHAGTANGCFAVSVSDTGPGIPEEHQGRIFEQFHQVDSSNTKAKGGTGLGLAIAKQIVEMHGGRIWVESAPGQGSTFWMELPIRAEAAGARP
jgi:signal transduction histidine kinase/putative methionine-R-sulfoxide reductase with GAF domain